MTDRTERHLQRITLQRNALKTNIRKELDKLITLTQATTHNEDALDTQLQKVHHFVDQLPTLDSQILDYIVEAEIDMQSEIDEAADFQSVIIDPIKSAENRLKSLTLRDNHSEHSSTGSGVTQTGPITRIHAKLPKLELPNFTGDPIQWQSFWDSFESKVHSDPSIPTIDNLHYLLKLLQGEAANAVVGYRPTSNNYPVVIDVLRERFGNPETAKFKHFEALFAIPSADSDASLLKDIYNECEKHIRCLVALGLSEDTFGQVFVPLILSKLPRTTRLQLHRTQGQQSWDLQSLRNLMKQEIVARDLTDRFSKGFGTTDQKSHTKAEGARAHYSKDNTSSASKPSKGWVTQGSLITHSGNQQKCTFCSGSHYSDACTKYKTAESRKTVLTNHCFNCLTVGHRISECRRTKPCFYCKGKGHHSSLCYKQFGSRSGSHGSEAVKIRDENKGKRSFTSTSQTSMSVSSQAIAPSLTILKMASVTFPNRRQPVRIYLDDGSSTSYVTTRLAKDLNLKLTGSSYVSVGRFGSNKRQSQQLRTAELPIPLQNGSIFTMPVHVITSITSSVQRAPLDPSKYPCLKVLPLADTLCSTPEMVEVDILLGGDYLQQLLTGERIHIGDGIFMYGSKLGYIAAGAIRTEDSDCTQHNAVTLFTQSMRLHTNDKIDRFWSLEDIGIKDNPHISENELALEKKKCDQNPKSRSVQGGGTLSSWFALAGWDPKSS